MFITIKDVCFSYSNSKENAVDGFSMTIEKEEVISF